MIRTVSKLTLSVDPEIAARAKRYAKAHGTSVSGMVQQYLNVVTKSARKKEDPPILRSLRGTLKEGSIEDYREYLEKKYL